MSGEFTGCIRAQAVSTGYRPAQPGSNTSLTLTSSVSRGLFPSPLVSHFFIRNTEESMLTCRIVVGMELNNAQEAPAGWRPGLQRSPGKDGSGQRHCRCYYCGATTLDGSFFNSCPRPETVNAGERMFPCWCMHVCVYICLSVRMHTPTHSRSHRPWKAKHGL